MLDRKLIEIVQVNPRYYIELKKAMKGHAHSVLTAVGSGGGLEELVGQESDERTLDGLRKWAQRTEGLSIEGDIIRVKGHEQKPAPAKAYARILNPLVYDHFLGAILDFMENEDARSISVPVNSHWSRVNVRSSTTTDREICRMANLAAEQGVLSIRFNFANPNDIFYNITFMRYKDKVVSSNVSIPGTGRDDFSWTGSDRYYNWINAIWSPVDIRAAAAIKSNVLHGYDIIAYALKKRRAA